MIIEKHVQETKPRRGGRKKYVQTNHTTQTNIFRHMLTQTFLIARYILV